MPPILHTAFKANQPRQRSFSAGLHLGGCGGESGAIVEKFLIYISPVITALRTRLSTDSDSERLRGRWPSRFRHAKNGQHLAARRRHVSSDAPPLASVKLPTRAAARTLSTHPLAGPLKSGASGVFCGNKRSFYQLLP